MVWEDGGSNPASYPIPDCVIILKVFCYSDEAVVGAYKKNLAKFKIPKKIIWLDELPRNTMGKVQKNVLRDTYEDVYSEGA